MPGAGEMARLRAGFGMSMMTHHEYITALRKLSMRHGVLFFAVVVPIANASTWRRELVFLAMLPAFLAPMLLGGWLISIADRRLGLKCHLCGKSLSMGRHVRRLLRRGGACPKCGTLVVDPFSRVERGASPNCGAAMPKAS